MKTSQQRQLKASALALASLSALAMAQPIPSIPPAQVHIDKVIVGKIPQGYTPTFSYDVNVKEILPPAPPGCKWAAPVYGPTSGTSTVNSGQVGAVTVTNTLVCQSVKCQTASALTTISLSQAASWMNGTNGPRFHVLGPIPGWATPTSTPNSEPGQWVGRAASGNAPAGTYDSDIPFCLCEGGSATAKVSNYRVDDKGELLFDSIPIPGTLTGLLSFTVSSPGYSGSGSITGAGTHKLISRVTNTPFPQGSKSGFAMVGNLEIKNGYAGVCSSTMD